MATKAAVLADRPAGDEVLELLSTVAKILLQQQFLVRFQFRFKRIRDTRRDKFLRPLGGNRIASKPFHSEIGERVEFGTFPTSFRHIGRLPISSLI
jgi:hypothetical protein